MTRNILLIGGGAREHAIARSIKNSNDEIHLFYCAPDSNPGIEKLSAGFCQTAVTDIDTIVRFAKNKKITWAFIGPEAPLEKGLSDQCQLQQIPCVGPFKNLAQIETSKGFTRNLMKKYCIDGLPRYRFFSSCDESDITDYLHALNQHYVIKADGLCGGKGVKVSGEHLKNNDEALHYCRELHGSFVIEEKLRGPEFSLISFSDGNTIKHCPAVQDHKRAFENDEGPNTGGMGSYSIENHRLPFLTETQIQQAQAMNHAVIKALQIECRQRYVGILYGGFMLTHDGVKVIEYNARFGDPEAINLLALLKNDFVLLCEHLINGTLSECVLQFAHQATVVKYVVPKGYPEHPVKANLDISLLKNTENIFFGAVTEKDNQFTMTGSRALAVLGKANTLEEAEKQAQTTIEKIKGPIFYRKDIGTQSLIDRYVRLSHDI